VRATRVVLPLFLSALAAAAPCFASEEPAREAALLFGRALRQADVAALQPILPRRGKVRLQLVRLGPEQGAYSASQVSTVLGDFLRSGRVDAYDLLRLDAENAGYALARAGAEITDRQGRRVALELHLTFQPEDGRWVLREVRESPP
jgi:hypothetical protein